MRMTVSPFLSVDVLSVKGSDVFGAAAVSASARAKWASMCAGYNPALTRGAAPSRGGRRLSAEALHVQPRGPPGGPERGLELLHRGSERLGHLGPRAKAGLAEQPRRRGQRLAVAVLFADARGVLLRER